MDEEDPFYADIYDDPAGPAPERELVNGRWRLVKRPRGGFDPPGPNQLIFRNGEWIEPNKLSFEADREPDPYADNPAFGAF